MRRRATIVVGVLLAVAALGVTPTAAQVSPGPLSRAHAELEGATQCFKCHGARQGEHATAPQCKDCHAEIAWLIEQRRGFHAGVVDRDCASCHPEHAGVDFELVAWPDGDSERFDHRLSGFPLDGKHAQTKCRDCHKPALQRSPAAEKTKRRDRSTSWLGLERECASCHRDVHAGTLGAACADCHDARTFKPASGFDHARSAYPLTGKHAEVACAKCHFVPGRVEQPGPDGRPVPRYKPLPHAECSDCHRDAHEGRLGSRCAECHVTTGFAVSKAGQFDHTKTRWPLRGKHATVDCARCHDTARGGWGKRPAFARCADCHADAHAGRATRAGRAVDCASCHDERAFRPSTYGVEDHRESGYALEGKHAQVACARCHPKAEPGAAAAVLGTARVELRPRHDTCRDCHADDHGGQLDDRPDRGACESCHRTDGFKPSTFTVERHAELGLRLEGKHADATCAACHGPIRPGLPALPGPERLGRARVAFDGVVADCATCHFDPHEGRFARGGARPVGAGCAACHDARAFRPSTVGVETHARLSWPLEGAHRATPCLSCHRELSAPAPAVRLLAVTGTARRLSFEREHARCANCHATVHGAQFAERPDGGACETCHDEKAFRPAPRFDHERDSGFALRGKHRDLPCAKCHPSEIDEAGKARTIYRPLARECKACHLPGAREERS